LSLWNEEGTFKSDKGYMVTVGKCSSPFKGI